MELQADALDSPPSCRLLVWEFVMTHEDFVYHSERARQCRALARTASDPEIGRLHAELAELHADRAANYMPASVIAMPGLSAAQ